MSDEERVAVSHQVNAKGDTVVEVDEGPPGATPRSRKLASLPGIGRQ